MKCLLSFLILASTITSSVASDEQDRELRDKYLYSNLEIDGVEKSWNKADVFVPENFFTKTPSSIKTDKVYPVVIYLHGCSGITQHDYYWAKYISSLGFVVIQPDSFARPNRKMMCNPNTNTVDRKLSKAFIFRQQEIGYALEQVKQSPWVDKNNIFLMGHSEGGVSAALSKNNEFKGVIISGWTCTHTVLGGIQSDKTIPVLAMAWTNDVWFYGRGLGTEGRCIDSAEGRINFTQIDIEGVGHGTYNTDKARLAVKTFLTKGE